MALRITPAFFDLRHLVVALAATSCTVHAQMVEELEFRKEAGNAVVQVRFGSAIQFQRSIASRSGDLFQVFYNVVSGNETDLTLVGERRVSNGRGLPEFVLTDEAVNRDNLTRRKLLVRFSGATKVKFRAGNNKQSLELVFEGMASSLEAVEKSKQPDVTPPRFAVNLQTGPERTEGLTGAIPSAFQDAVVFTSQRVVNGVTQYDINLGYFESLPSAQAAAAQLSKRFPAAVAYEMRPPVTPASFTASTAPLAAGAVTQASPNAAIAASGDVEGQAKTLHQLGLAALDRGDYQEAITAFDGVLALPVNSLTRSTQEKMGVTRLESGDRTRARAEFEAFVATYPQGEDSDRVRQYLVNLPAHEVVQERSKGGQPQSVVSGSVSSFYYGGQSQTRSQDFVDSPLGGLPVLQSQGELSSADQKQLQTNVDLNWRYRDAEVDRRFVLRDSYSADYLPGRPSRNRLSALYFDEKRLKDGVGYRVGRQSPTGGGVLYRYDGAQGFYTFAPKWRLNAVVGQPTDALLDSRRHFYGAWVDADSLTEHVSGSFYVNRQMIDGEVDRQAFGSELRYFKEGIALSAQLDYDQMLQGMNIASVQGSWQTPDNTVYNFLLDRRATPVRSLGNALFFQDPALTTQARTIQELLGTTPIDLLRARVNGVTSFQSQAMLGFTTPIAANWQAGSNLNYTNVDAIAPVAVILPNGQASTGDLWSVGLQLIGSNLYSARDTHVFNINFLTGPTYNGKLFSYNNLTGIDEAWQFEPSIRFYTQTDNVGTKTNRWTPGVRVTYRVVKRVSLESELSIEIADVKGTLRTENSERMFYYVGGRFDF
ncbi:tetratricopeptide repeat protein [Rhodoferax mekongensis]|uniref:tetratricopeptide repeat protein n=1 Tax=Rhodoferax mekongensis TaxID=3068341 RepID=UPI0028BEB055|nr:hypothetical protein [Rhodoferax sp. TBRC 17199]MDT7517054.1 hypothetical protein [Rhodoferax sp. TBRC 17199]